MSHFINQAFDVVAVSSATYSASFGIQPKLHVCDTSGTTVAITLPAISSLVDGQSGLMMFYLGLSGNDLTITRSGSDTIIGGVTKTIDKSRQFVTFMVDAANSDWKLYSTNKPEWIVPDDDSSLYAGGSLESCLDEIMTDPFDIVELTGAGGSHTIAKEKTAMYIVTTAAGTQEIVFPEIGGAVDVESKEYIIYQVAGGNNLTLTPNVADTINGAASVVLDDAGAVLKFVADATNTNWVLTASNRAADQKLLDANGYFTAGNAEAAFAELITDPLKRVALATGDTPYTVIDEKSVILVADTSGGVLEIDLPEIGGSTDIEDKLLIIHQIAGGNTLTIDPNGTQTINGGGAGVALTMDHAGAVLFLYADSNDNWTVVTSNEATYTKVLDTAGYFTSGNLEGVLAELGAGADGVAAVSATPQTLTAADVERVFSYDDTAGTIAANLPEASTVIGRKYIFIKTAGGNQVDLTPDAADDIDGAGVGVAYSLTQNGEWVLMMALDAVNWKILATNLASKVTLLNAAGKYTATEAEAAFTELRADQADGYLPVDLWSAREITANATLTQDITSQVPSIVRTAGVTNDTYHFTLDPPQRTTASKGKQVTGIRVAYQIGTAIFNTNLSLLAYKVVEPADGAAAASAAMALATGLTNTVASHTTEMLFSAAEYLDDKHKLVMELRMDDTGGGTATMKITHIGYIYTEVK